jgi:hypothetical protein
VSRHNTLLATIVALVALFLASAACSPATESVPSAVVTETQPVATASAATTEPTPLAVATDIPTVPAFVGTYRLRTPNYYQGTDAPPAEAEYYLTLGEDGSVQLEEENVSTGQTSLIAQGAWRGYAFHNIFVP